MRNAYLVKLQQKKEHDLRAHRNFTIQWCTDAAVLAANEVFGRRGKKLVEFIEAFERYSREIAEMTMEDAKADKSIEYTKARLDGRLKELLGEDFKPWEEWYSI